MKIIKTERKTGVPEVCQKGFSGLIRSVGKNGKRNLMIACSLLLIGGAVWLNWALFAKADTGEDYQPGSGTPSVGEIDGNQTSDDPANQEQDTDSYFAMAQIDRTRARDEALEVLEQITASADATDEAKENAYISINRLSRLIEQEANIETLVKSKGFSECVAVLDGENANVIVLSDGLTDSQRAQIVEIVFEQSGVKPANLHIIEKKPA